MSAVILLHPTADFSWTHFSVHPSTVLGVAALGALYAWRARTEQRAGALPAVRPHPSAGQKLAFVSGLAVLFLTLNGPIHDLSDSYLFSAHMVQHLLLTMLVIPLLIAGTPGWMLRPALRYPVVAAVARRITTGPAAFVIFNFTLVVWHLPPLYNAALFHHPVHIVQHLCFLVASTLMWWPLMSPLPELPRLSYPQQMLYAFLMTLPMTAVSIFITYADTLLYPFYTSAPRLWGLSPHDDQLLGGLIMWIPGGLIFLVVLTVVFFRWAASGEDDVASAQVVERPA
jgi:putative membrane protein